MKPASVWPAMRGGRRRYDRAEAFDLVRRSSRAETMRHAAPRSPRHRACRPPPGAARGARTGGRASPSSARQPGRVLRLGVGRAQVERFGRRGAVGRGGAEPRDPDDVGGAARSITRGGSDSSARPRARRLAARADEPGGRSSRRGRLPAKGQARGTSVRPPGPKFADRRGRAARRSPTTTGWCRRRDKRRREAGERGEADHRLAGGERQAAGGREPTRSPVKLPGPVVTAMRSSSGKSAWASSITARSAASGLPHGRAPSGGPARDDAAALSDRARPPNRLRVRCRWQGCASSG